MQIDDIIWCADLFNRAGQVFYYRQEPHPRTQHVACGMQCFVHQNLSNVEILKRFQHIVEMGEIKNYENQYRLVFKTKEVNPLFLILQPYLGEAKLSDFRFTLLAYDSHDSKATKDDWDRVNAKWEKKLNKDKETE